MSDLPPEDRHPGAAVDTVTSGGSSIDLVEDGLPPEPELEDPPEELHQPEAELEEQLDVEPEDQPNVEAEQPRTEPRINLSNLDLHLRSSSSSSQQRSFEFPPRRTSNTDRRSSIVLRESPVARSQLALVQDGMRQSMGRYGSHDTAANDVDVNSTSYPHHIGQNLQESTTGSPLIDGRVLTVSARGREPTDFAPVRLWDKEDRIHLPGDIRQAFVKAATGYVLPKNNKLSAPQIVSADSKFLIQALNLQSQLKMIKEHMITYDIFDVMTIVVPIDVQHTMAVERRTYNLLEDYPQLHAVVVANSCTWYNRWVTNRYIQENMALTYTFLQNNTEESLWSKCLDLYDEFSPIQQGGPLMAFLILQRIQDSSEQALDLLRVQIVALDLRKTPGEDVETAVSLIKSTYRVLKNSSTSNRSYVPNDFVKSVFKIFQTSSVPEFNEIFKTKQRDIQVVADTKGVQPQWPRVTEVINLALNSYRRLKNSGTWDEIVKNPAKALLGAPSTTIAPASGLQCWNCGGHHHLKDCTKALDQAKIDRARQQFKQQRKGRGKTLPRHATGSDGKPLVLNKNGAYVLDQQAWRAVRAHLAITSAPSRSDSAPSTTGTPSQVTVQADAIRSALRSTQLRTTTN